MKKTVKTGFLAVLLAFVLTACATGGVNMPLPKTISIEQPGPDVPKEIADYIGAWKGKWGADINREISTIIVIEKITPREIRAIYSWLAPSYNEEGWDRLSGKIENGKIILYNRYINIELKKNPGAETISAIYARKDGEGYFTATLFKKDLKDLQIKTKQQDAIHLSRLPEKIRTYHGRWEGEFNNGTPIIEDIEVVSEKKVLVTHSWWNNPNNARTKAGSWPPIETEFNKDGYISITRGNKILTIKLNEDGTLNVGLKLTDKNRYVSGNLKKR